MEQSVIIQEGYTRLKKTRALFVGGLLSALAVLIGVAVTLGSADFTVGESYLAILAGLFPGTFSAPDLATTIVWDFRLHRVLFAVCAGFGLAVAGSVMQGILGIASAATTGASIAIVLGAGVAGGEYLVIGNAFLFALLAALAIYGMARYRGIGSETMVLAGIAVMYLFSAVTSLLQYVGSAEQLQAVVFWTFGSVDKSTWPKLGIVALVLACTIPYLIYRAWDLNALAEGDEVAASLGVPVERSMILFMMIASLLTAVIICFTGTIGFIGLVAPHITRMVVGGDFRTLLPASGLVGALLLLSADSIARSVLAPQVLPVGIVTAFLGVPFFIYLFLHRRNA